MHLAREVVEGIEDSTEAALINLCQSKTFDRVDHRFLVTFGDCQVAIRVLQMDFHDVPQTAGSGAGEQEAFEVFCNWGVCLVELLPISSSLCPRSVGFLESRLRVDGLHRTQAV